MLTSHAHAVVNSPIFLDVLLFDIDAYVDVVVVVSSDHWHHNVRVIPSHVFDQLVLMFASEVAVVSGTGQQCGQMDPLDMVAHFAAQITAEATVRIETFEHVGHVRALQMHRFYPYRLHLEVQACPFLWPELDKLEIFGNDLKIGQGRLEIPHHPPFC